VTGIGFLGGGAILKYGASVRGLTTAATLWTTAAIGMAVGVGEYWTALAVTAIALVALVGLRPVRRILRRHAVNTGELVVEAREQMPLAEVLGDVERHGANVTSLRIDDRSDGYLIHVFAKLSPGASPAQLAGEIAGRPYAASVDWRST
jgi:putative Mg2+ transporter-C (MgtC) family protein